MGEIGLSDHHREIADQPQASFVVADSGLKEKIHQLEKSLVKLPQVLVPPEHEVFGGMYARTGMIPAGTMFIGVTHTKDHINVVFGDVTVLTENGPVRFTGYQVLPAKAGSKRVAFTHSDTMWTTLVRTDLTDVEAIEDEICEDSSALQTRNGTIKKEVKPCY